MTLQKTNFYFIEETTSYFEYLVVPNRLELLSILGEKDIIRIPRNILEKRSAMVEHKNEIIALSGNDWYDHVIFPILLNIEGYMTSKLTRLPLPLLEEMDKRHRKYADNIRYMRQHLE
ncbi:hypothetical protein [Listeria monocytogenes]|uniref:hypothetical protein n=1 Tax=Listeria monocytogenes TaxID=1639 RepID=UPI0011EB9336|nr:hypothetical protein [Listeria monocytogenes]TYV31020.1 hypothetical protein FZ060_15380 [Listeria monocytogenes]